VVQFNGREEIVASHRRAIADMGLQIEIIGLIEAQHVATGIQMLRFGQRPAILSAIVANFDDAGLLREVYSYVGPTT
jgi:hypothetical protein